MHVVDPADEPEDSDGLVGGDDQLDAGPLARREHGPEMRVACAARAEDRLVAGVVHGAGEAEPFSEAASPLERRLAAAAVVGQSAPPSKSSSRPRTVRRWYSTDSIPIILNHAMDLSRGTQPGGVANVFSQFWVMA